MEPSSEVVAAAAAGRKIEAIKLLRAEQGMGLAEAKAVIDALPEQSGIELSTRAAGREDRGTTRLIAILVAVGIVAAIFYLF